MVVPLVIAGQAILHGLRIAGLRILPYIVREATKKSATYAAKKVGQKSITETGYVIVTKDPTKFRLAQQIFGKNKVFRNESILQAQSTASKEIVPLSQKLLKSASPEVRTTILKQADDAANGVSKFISSSKVQTVGGTKVAEPFKQFFGKNLKFSDKTVEVIKKAEMGPPSLSKEVVKVAKDTGSPKFLKEFSGTKTPEVIKMGQSIPKIDTKNAVSVVKEVTEKRPWYVNVMPKVLRTRKETLNTNVYPHVRTVTEGVAKGRLASAVGTGYGMYEGAKYMSRNMNDTDEVRSSINIDDNDLFETESRNYEQEQTVSGINIYDTDEEGNVIQAQ